MSLDIKKGESLNISKTAADAGAPLVKLVAGAGWDAKGDKNIDLDLLAVYVGEDGKAIPDANGNGTNLDEAVCYFSNKDLPGAHHTGDNLTGEGEGDDEQIVFTLADVPANAKEIAIVIASYSGEKFSEVENAFVRMVNESGNTELVKFKLKEGMGDTRGVELGRVVRNGSEWEFKATGRNIEGDFNEIVASFGVTEG